MKTERSIGQRLLAPVAQVERSEVAGVLLMALTMLLLLGAYYMLKTAREALILTHGGAEIKTYSSAGQALVLLALIPAFSALASRVNRTKLVSGVTMFFMLNIGLFALFGQSSRLTAIIYFLWVGIFSVMVITQFWGFANDLYTPEQGKRLFPIIGLGSSLGAWLGSSAAGRAIAVIGPFPLMLVAGCILGACVVLAALVHRWQRRAAPSEARVAADETLGKTGAFTLIRQDRYLIYLMLLTVMVNVMTTSADYMFGRVLVNESLQRFGDDPASMADRERFVGGIYGRLYGTINLVGFLMQALVVSRVFKYLGVANALLIHPLISLAGFLLLLGRPSIPLVVGFRVADASTDYSIDNTTRQAMWLPTSREAKYKAKQAVDSFFVRVGDMVQAAIVYMTTSLALGIHAFSTLMVGLVGVWLVIALALRRLYRQRVDPPTAARRAA